MKTRRYVSVLAFAALLALQGLSLFAQGSEGTLEKIERTG